jgi:hypothetical protein
LCVTSCFFSFHVLNFVVAFCCLSVLAAMFCVSRPVSLFCVQFIVTFNDNTLFCQ